MAAKCNLSIQEEKYVDTRRSESTLSFKTLPIQKQSPNKNVYGYLIVVASFLVHMSLFGQSLSFGVFLDYYITQKEIFEFDVTSLTYSNVALVGTVATSSTSLLSLFTGRLSDKPGPRLCILFSMVVSGLGLVVASFSTKAWHLILSQGLLVGAGCALAYVPVNAAVVRWYDNDNYSKCSRKGLAVGVGTSGMGIGGLLFSLINSHLLNKFGFRWALRLNACIVIITLLVASILTKLPDKIDNADIEQGTKLPLKEVISKSDSKTFGLKDILNRTFLTLSICTIFSSFAYHIPFFYIPQYAASDQLIATQGASLVAIMNGSSALFRIIIGMLADKFGHLNVYLLCLLTSLLSLVVWKFSTSLAALVSFSIVYGAAAGGFAGLFPTVSRTLFGLNNLGSLMGVAYSFTAIGNFFGPLTAGSILDRYANYNYLIYYNMGLYATACIMFSIIRFVIIEDRFKLWR